MRIVLTAALVWLLSTVVATAAVRPLVLETSPGAADVYVDGSTLVGRTPAGFSGALTLRVDDAAPHSFSLRCKPYNDIRLTVRWTADRWMVTDCSVLAPNRELSRLAFSRNVRFDIRPAPVAAWQVTTSVVGAGQKMVDGQPLERMEESSDGAFIVREAFQRSRVYLEAAGGEMLAVDFKEGELSAQSLGDYIVSGLAWKQTAKGWLVAAVLTLLAAVVGLLYWRRGQAVSPQPRLQAGATAVASVDERPSLDSNELPNLVGRELTTDGGQTFRVLRRIGKGGMGAVFEAESVGAERADPPWAVKVLYAGSWEDAEFRERFRREVRFCAALHHPNIVKILDWGLYTRPHPKSRQWPFMVMERVNGVELSRYVGKPAEGVSPRQAVIWIIEALQALGVAHGAGIIHRDLKPANIMITTRGHVKIMDFGVARQDEMDGLTRTDTAIGTPYYMSPEHLDAKHVTPASDVYSMGIILFELLSGRTPFEGRDVSQVLLSKLQGRSLQLATLRPDLPRRLCQIVHRMFARVPEVRYMSVDAVIDELEPLLRDLSNDV